MLAGSRIGRAHGASPVFIQVLSIVRQQPAGQVIEKCIERPGRERGQERRLLARFGYSIEAGLATGKVRRLPSDDTLHHRVHQAGRHRLDIERVVRLPGGRVVGFETLDKAAQQIQRRRQIRERLVEVLLHESMEGRLALEQLCGLDTQCRQLPALGDLQGIVPDGR
ncbi:hypothetical protein D3C81_1504030 [compost metagenome]